MGEDEGAGEGDLRLGMRGGWCMFLAFGGGKRGLRGGGGEGGRGGCGGCVFGGVVSRLCPVCLFRFVRGDVGGMGGGGSGTLSAIASGRVERYLSFRFCFWFPVLLLYLLLLLRWKV